MVAKKTAAKKTSAAGSAGTAGTAKDATGKKTTITKKVDSAAPARKTATKTATKADGTAKSAPKPTADATSKASKAPKVTAGNMAPEKTAAKKTAAKKAPAGEKAPAKKTVAKKAATKQSPAAEKAPAKKAPAKKAAVEKKAASAAQVEQTGARTVAAKKTAGGVTTAESEVAVPQARAGELAVRPGEDPWTPEEVTEARAGLESEVLRLRAELLHSQEELTGLMRDSGDGAGDDQADTGTKNITREHELALAANAREMLEQSEHALERLDAGTYGLCEVCGKPIGKARMQAFLRATLCVEDKQKQERRG
ncbi:TraR/DksA family transcriptional regulator [Streptomyces sp. NPDC002992]|uniref:TraR/DksA family transcriptional regulator n=1 Tax=Streptomyces sp. NPDC002992 TaxID=3154273 RepID=UPI0033AE3714